MKKHRILDLGAGFKKFLPSKGLFDRRKKLDQIKTGPQDRESLMPTNQAASLF